MAASPSSTSKTRVSTTAFTPLGVENLLANLKPVKSPNSANPKSPSTAAVRGDGYVFPFLLERGGPPFPLGLPRLQSDSASRLSRSPGPPGLALVAAPDRGALGQELKMTLSNTQSSILRQAAADGVAIPPARLPPGPRASLARALLTAGLVARAQPADGTAGWKLDGEIIWLAITDEGRQAIAEVNSDLPPLPEGERSIVDTPPSTTREAASAQEAPVTSPLQKPRPTLRESAAALLERWDNTTERAPLADAIAALRAALAPTLRQTGSPRGPRQGTKQEAVLTLLRRPEGATIAHIIEATGWAQHTVRGFFAGLKKKGHAVEVLDRVRQVGPGSAGAKGSYSIYRLGGAG